MAPIDRITRRRTRCHRADQTRKHELFRELTKHTDRRTHDTTNESVDAPFGMYAQPTRRPNGRTNQRQHGRRTNTRYNVERRDNANGEQRRKMISNERAEKPTTACIAPVHTYHERAVAQNVWHDSKITNFETAACPNEIKMNKHDLVPSTHERTQQETDGTYGHLTRTDGQTKVTGTITKPRRSDGPDDNVATTDSPNDNAKHEHTTD